MDDFEIESFEPDPKDLMKAINNLSIIFFKLMGINIDDELKKLDDGAINYFVPGTNAKNQLIMPLKMYLGLNELIRKRLRQLNMVEIDTKFDSQDVLDLIDEIEDLKNEKESH